MSQSNLQSGDSPYCHVIRWMDFGCNLLAALFIILSFVLTRVVPYVRQKQQKPQSTSTSSSKPSVTAQTVTKTRQASNMIKLLFQLFLPLPNILRAFSSGFFFVVCGHALDEGTLPTILLASANYLFNFIFLLPIINWALTIGTRNAQAAKRLQRSNRNVNPELQAHKPVKSKVPIQPLLLTIFDILFNFFIPAVLIIATCVTREGQGKSHEIGLAINNSELWYFVFDNFIVAAMYGGYGFMVISHVSRVIKQAVHYANIPQAHVSRMKALKRKLIFQTLISFILFFGRALLYIFMFTLKLPVLVNGTLMLIKCIVGDVALPISILVLMGTRTVTKVQKPTDPSSSYVGRSRSGTSNSTRLKLQGARRNSALANRRSTTLQTSTTRQPEKPVEDTSMDENTGFRDEEIKGGDADDNNGVDKESDTLLENHDNVKLESEKGGFQETVF
ncbi:hypothetical protein BLNAU_14226 [Blattamonas nauphoetae]|uniref:Uncharacterized protein n=1 Tax=Blattamonas nauphoetae TaxID=2049346 RepID=A0ABQ9XHM2_9EUKA|nr:hypothetical protein BLNAU_14226 [Blattamonas nauphoetae]